MYTPFAPDNMILNEVIEKTLEFWVKKEFTIDNREEDGESISSRTS